MSFKKYDGSTWQPINPKQLKGVPYSGTLPAVIAGTKAGYLHRYKIYGNLTQNGTPSPENPIYPSECGERTANLFDKDVTLDGYWLSSANGVAVPSSGYSVSDYIRTSDGESYTLVEAGKTFCWYDENKGFISTTAPATTASAPTGAVYFRVNLYTANKGTAMVVKGSTPLPYEPYGYKLPLTTGSTPVDIYLGESQTTRRIKKLVLTGEETGTWTRNSAIISGNAYYNTSIFANYKARTGIGYCTHYPLATAATATIGVYFGAVVNMISAISEGLDTAEKWKTYLAQQYANGTPVTVWYVLAEPETAVVNEPLRKIGNYADTIDSTQTTAQIPTTAGSTTVSWAGQGLAPSQFDSIQEWVDAQTYKRVNGAWVADN